ncbi:aspartate dehydrogenase [Delftia sp. PS-11]|uniref:aspartate dehydrogenase n=1 Tax=Delftia sp. PS-11 TaxID=2767222 RepID=UPI002458AABF|nr:aspartate dehydrogenase [Delftia sp. PS-11]KAJ8744777.1 aspartate dehydrogenase [Delftia sp. PS-11]
MKIAVIGCGAIGASVLELLSGHAGVQVGWVLVSSATEAVQATVARHAPQARVQAVLAADDRPDLIVECAGHAAIEQHVLPALRRGIPAIVASIGALGAPGMAGHVQAAAEAGGTQVQLLSGAIGGVDALAAARIGGLDEVVYTGRKPPLAWSGTPAEQLCDLASLKEALCIFDGSAREAARRYPKNANVAATLSLAGLGLDRTRVRLFADPAVDENVHHVAASGAFGAMELTMRGKPLAANPKTSALTVYSVVRAVLNQAAPVAI